MGDWGGLDIWSAKAVMIAFDWVSTSRNLEVTGMKSTGRNKKTWGDSVRQDMDLLGLRLKKAWATDRVEWLDEVVRPTLARMEK